MKICIHFKAVRGNGEVVDNKASRVSVVKRTLGAVSFTPGVWIQQISVQKNPRVTIQNPQFVQAFGKEPERVVKSTTTYVRVCSLAAAKRTSE